MILIDVDNFNCFNDQYGHDFGDKVLSNVAALMSASCARATISADLAGTNF